MSVQIYSPIARHNGAAVVHQQLARHVPGYYCRPYSPRLEYFPLSFLALRQPKAALVHCPADYGGLLTAVGQPLVATFHNYVLDAAFLPLASPVQKLHYRTALRAATRHSIAKASALTAVSRHTADLARRDLQIQRDIRVIYNGVDAAHFRPDSPRPPHRHFRVGFAGNLNARKTGAMGDICRLLPPDYEFYIATERRTALLPAWATGAAFVGSVPHAQMPEFYQRLDVLLLPSFREGFCLAVAEAMACGLPVVTGESPGELIVHGKGGYLCPVTDPQAFADALQSLADNPSMRHEMGQFNRARVERMFTIGRMVADYRALFERVLDGA